jgi:DNA replication and repair protein RecF
MFLQSLEISNFRNIHTASVNFNHHLNVFCGKNGQGKTSFLEAIYFLSCAKSFRTKDKKDLLRVSEQETVAAKLKGKVKDSNLLESELGLIIEPGRSIKFSLHNKDVKFSEGYLGTLLTVCFSPNDLEIIRGEPSLRRNFLDKHLSDIYPAYLALVLRLNKAVKSKIQLLNSDRIGASELDPWDHIIAETSYKIFSFRKVFLNELLEYSINILPLVANTDGELKNDLKSCCYDSLEGKDLDIEQIFKLILEKRNKEIILKRCLIGAHRDDFCLSLSGLAVREFSSQGQARTLTLLLKLGVIELIESKTAERPIIILDDVDSELDSERGAFLFKIFAEKNRQLFVSTTDSNKGFFPSSSNFFGVAKGEIFPQ